jgi:hypothetical protein
MFLCNYDGKLYNDNDISKKVILTLAYDYGNTDKDQEGEVCCQCWGLLNMKYKVNENHKFVIPIGEKVKLYKISSHHFDNKGTKHKTEDDNKKLITDILKKMKSSEKKNCKKC